MTSSIVFINLEMKFQYQENHAYSLVVKPIPEDPKYREFFDTDVNFHNEINTYAEVVHFVEEIPRKGKTDR